MPPLVGLEVGADVPAPARDVPGLCVGAAEAAAVEADLRVAESPKEVALLALAGADAG